MEKKIYYNNGQAVILLSLFFLFISGAIVSGMIFSAISRTRIAREFPRSKQSYFLGEAGAEDVAYRIMRGKNYDATEVLQLNGSSATIATTENLATGATEISAEADVGSNIRLAEIHLIPGTNALFSYGVQVGNGGLEMEQTSTVSGNVYANGTIVGANNNAINGDAVSAEATGLIDNVNIAGDAYAHTLIKSDIDEKAYYQSIDGATKVGGAACPNPNCFPGSPDQPNEPFPISDAKLDEWEQLAATTVISSPCPYKITSAQSIGPAKITCDVEIKGNFTVTLTGALWITGNLTTKNNPISKNSQSMRLLQRYISRRFLPGH